MKNRLKKQQNKKTWYQITNRVDSGLAETTIEIMEDIGFWGRTAKDFRGDLKMLGAEEPLHVHINSDGGDIIEGNEIYNALLEHNGPVRVTVGALAASMASVIAMAGDTIEIAENGFMMVHNPWTLAMGDSEELRKSADVMDKMKANIIKAYKTQSHLSETTIANLMDAETWMTAQEAVDNGFCDSVCNELEPVEEAVNNFDLSKFRNSTKFLTRLRAEHLEKRPGNRSQQATGNSGRVTVLDLQRAIEAETDPPSGEQPGTASRNKPIVIIRNQPMKQEPTGGPAATTVSPEEQQAAIKKKAEELYANKLKRDNEIDDIVLTVRNRDKKDFAELGTRFKQEDKTADDFARAIVNSDEFKKFEVVGSGIELIEPLDQLKGSPGFSVVTNEHYKAIAQQVLTRGRGSIPQKTQLIINTPYRANQAHRFLDVAGAPTSTGLTSIEKLPGIVTLGVRPLMVKDLLAPGATTSTTIRYIREVSFTNGATTVTEGAAKPLAVFEYVEVDAAVRKIAAYVKVTDELFADYLQMASYINQRLPYMVERTEEDQLLNGDGNAPNLLGLLQTVGIQTQAKAGDTAADAMFKALTKIRSIGFFEPDGYIVHPNDWEQLRLAKDGNLNYYGGGPFTGAYGNGPLVQFDSFWGKPCAITPAITEGTALAGSFKMGAQYFQREGLTLDMTNSDQDDFVKNLMTIRAEERLALAVYRPLAFCSITGI